MEELKKMKIPSYILDEIEEYVYQKEQGNLKCMKLNNINTLLRLAIINNRITEEKANQVKDIIINKNFK